MKRLLSLAAMFLCCMATTFAQFSGSGAGTENDPYLILNPIQLNQMRNFLNKEKVYFKLMADIDLSEFIEDEYPSKGWLPIGSLIGGTFKGVIDGNHKKITGLWVNRSNSDYIGLFGYVQGASIKDLSLNVKIIGNEYVGAFFGDGAAAVSGCYVDGVVQGSTIVGGCSGRNLGSFLDCYSSAYVTTTGDFVGGIAGIGSKFSNCKCDYVIVNGGDYVGGICGRSASLTNCLFSGIVKGKSKVGGLVGYHYSTISDETIKQSTAIGDVVGTGDEVGGIVGSVDHSKHGDEIISLEDCYFSGNVSGYNNVGGIFGYFRGWYGYNEVVKRCYSYATISGVSNVGGIAGQGGGRIINCIAINKYLKAKEGNFGLIRGNDNSNDGNNKAYNRTIVICQGVVQEVEDSKRNGTGVSATTLKLKATYVAMGFDFSDTWEIQETECYPYFKTQTAPPIITSKVVSGATTISGKCVDGGIVTLEVDGVKQQIVSSNHEFSFMVSPLQAGHEVRVSAKAEGKEQSYFTTETVSYLGKGTEDDPYQVYTASDLTGVYRKGYYKLMNDIDLTDYINQFSPTEGWESIGREGSETIHFDGDGHKITGLWCNSTRDNTGLFSCFANGYIKNLTVETAKDKQVKGGNNTGIIIGKMINGIIENCQVTGNVSDGTPVGGIVGQLEGGKVLLSQASIKINTTGEDAFVGGLVGHITSGEIDQCVAQGVLTSNGKKSQVGGLVGKSEGTITNCYSNADVNSSYCAAGLVAYNYGLVEKSYAVGNLASNNYAAGVVGYNDGANANIRCCAAMNKKIDLKFESQSAQSGGYGQRILGGMKNSAPAPDLNNYALKTMKVSVNDVPQKIYDDIMNGMAKTGTELMSASTYQELGWNFTNTWSITEGKEYPALKNNPSTVLHAEADPVTVTAKSYSREYGEANPTFEFTSEGAALNGTPEITCEATASSPVGTYPIIIKKGSVTNYNDTYVNGTLTITKAPLTVTVEDATREQYLDNPEFVITYTGWKVSDDESVLTKKPTATTTATKDSPVGTYAIVVSGGEAKNYELNYQNGVLTIIESTGIGEITVTSPADVYTLQGHKVRTKATTLKGLPKGVYIVNGNKVVIK